jgi:single-stranded-DNA-specific exonuclease
MAAGVSLLPENLPTFQRRLSESVAAQLSKISAPSVLTVDSYVPLSALSLELVAQLERLAPFGSGNPRPLLATQNLTISGSRSLGREGLTF